MACGVCDGDQARRDLIDRKLAEGMRPTALERTLREPSMPIGFRAKAETIARHARRCLGMHLPSPLENATTEDLARMVQRRTLKAVASGTLQPTIAHGLKAQQLIDRREERQQDRDLQLGIARMLAAQHTVVPMPMDVIEGDYVRLGELTEPDPETREPAPVVRRGSRDTRNARRRLAAGG